MALPAVELPPRPRRGRPGAVHRHGPSCDSSDTTFFGVYLPATLDAGDRLYIGSAGAYTPSYASNFNGFPPPAPVFIGQA